MKARVNTTGTHVKDGFLKVRIDLYPDPADKTYAVHYVDKYDRELTEEEMADPAKLALVPRHKGLNPCLCHFFTVDGDITPAELEAMVQDAFDAGTLQALGDALTGSGPVAGRGAVSQIMAAKSGCGRKLAGDAAEVIAAVNERLKNIEVQF